MSPGRGTVARGSVSRVWRLEFTTAMERLKLLETILFTRISYGVFFIFGAPSSPGFGQLVSQSVSK